MSRFELCSMLRFCVIVRYIRRGTPDAGFALFESESLKWPGFVEFDDVNGKVLTYSAQDRFVFYCSDFLHGDIIIIMSRLLDRNTYFSF